MNILDFIKHLLFEQKVTNYIIAVQIPIVLCLVIQCYQTYKLNFKEFKLLSIAWSLNLLYLFINIFLRVFQVEDANKLIVKTTIDLINMYVFYIAVIKSFELLPFNKLKTLPKYSIILTLIFVGICKNIPGSLNLIPYVHIRYIPAAIIDFLVIFLLAFFFKNLCIKYNLKQFLFYITFFYAIIQFLSILNIDPHEQNLKICIDNIGFSLGLFCKVGILIGLSITIVNAVKISVIEEKEELLKKSNHSYNRILNIKGQLSTNLQDQENSILNLVLTEALSLLSKELGYYSSYNFKTKRLQIMLTSSVYNFKKGVKSKIGEGLAGKAVQTRVPHIMRKLSDKGDYKIIPGDKSNLNTKVNSALAIPIEVDNQILGVYMIECENENSFSELDVIVIASLISQAAIAIKNIRLVQDIKISKIFLDNLRQIDKEIVQSHLDVETILNYILNRSLQLVKSEFGNIDLVNGQKLVCLASTNIANKNMALDINSSLSGKAVISKSTIYIPDLNKYEYTNDITYKDHLGKGYQCELIVPLIVNEEVIGIFNAESKQVNKFSKDDIERIEGYAGQAAIAIYIAKLIADINAKDKALENSVDKEKIELSIILGKAINHRIGNSVGTIRTIVKDKLLFGQYGDFSEPILAEFNIILACAERVLAARNEISEKVKEALFAKPERIKFEEVKRLIEQNEDICSHTNISIDIIGFDILRSISVNLNLFMEGIVLELIRNSIKSMPDGGKIIITGKTEDSYNIITFTDKGCGIEAADKDKIFKKGYTNWKNSAGSGIGLFELASLIEFYHGHIEVSSSLGEGTSFIIQLPII